MKMLQNIILLIAQSYDLDGTLYPEDKNENSKKYHSINRLSARSLGLGCDSDGIDRFHQEWRRSH